MTATKVKTPEHIGFVDPLTVSPDSARAPELQYELLRPYADSRQHAAKEWDAVLWNELENGVAEEKAARELATHYLLQTAIRLSEADNNADRAQWSDRLTTASQELFGAPDPDAARSLFVTNTKNLVEAATAANVDRALIDSYQSLTGAIQVGDTLTAPEVDKNDTEQLRQEMQAVIEARYTAAFAALELDTLTDSIDAAGIADAFDRTLKALAETYDESWSEWKVVRKEGADSLAVHATKREISVGKNRAAVSKNELKALLAHEILTHALGALNGYKLSQPLGDGLPGFLDIEEGMGVFNEYAVTGALSDKVADRYTDIALAMGQIDGHMHTRQELITLALTRAHVRNEAQPDGLKLPDDVIEAEVYKTSTASTAVVSVTST